jgi:Protein of unknown function (DUF559)
MTIKPLNAIARARSGLRKKVWLEKEGYRVIRFWNSEVTNDLNTVLEQIYIALHGAREAEALRLKHQRRPKSSAMTPPRPVREG